jgi:hypothetical protein
MLNGRDPQTGEGLSDENIVYQLLTFLIAGMWMLLSRDLENLCSRDLQDMRPPQVRRITESNATFTHTSMHGTGVLRSGLFLDIIVRISRNPLSTASSFIFSSHVPNRCPSYGQKLTRLSETVL